MTINDAIILAADRLEWNFPTDRTAQEAAELLRAVWMYEPKDIESVYALAEDLARHEHHTNDALQAAQREITKIWHSERP